MSEVLDCELLYRRIPNEPKNYRRDAHGHYHAQPAAYMERRKEPSVNRAHMHDYNPSYTQAKNTDFVVSLVAKRVRNISEVPDRRVDVLPAPIKNDPNLEDNPAHAIILCKPGFVKNDKNNYRAFRIALARMSEWEVSPG